MLQSKLLITKKTFQYAGTMRNYDNNKVITHSTYISHSMLFNLDARMAVPAMQHAPYLHENKIETQSVSLVFSFLGSSEETEI